MAVGLNEMKHNWRPYSEKQKMSYRKEFEQEYTWRIKMDNRTNATSEQSYR